MRLAARAQPVGGPGAPPLRGPRTLELGGALTTLTVAVALFTRFGIDDTLRRDEAVYAYAGQQLAQGVPPYVSIFDPKTPLAEGFAGVGAAVGRLVGSGDVHAIRLTFFGLACATVLAVYLLALRLWHSVLAAVVTAVVFAGFRGFAMDAIAGPDAKTPGILFAVLSMALAVRRRWFWAALAGSLAFLVWQPLAVYAAVAVAGAALDAGPGERRTVAGRALAGAAVPVVLTTVYFWLAGGLGAFVEAAFVFPVTGLHRVPETVTARLQHIAYVVRHEYLASGVLFWVGLVLLLGLAAGSLQRLHGHRSVASRDPVLVVVLPTFLALAAFSARDFQGYPDVYPLLPYAALGFGGATSMALARSRHPVPRRIATAGALLLVTAVASLSWVSFSHDPAADGGLVAQRADARGLVRLLGPDGTLYSLGDPTPLVLTQRRNPSRFVYLDSGEDRWDVQRTAGGYRGWKDGIRDFRPVVVVLHEWTSPLEVRTATWLRSSYDRVRVGPWHVFLGPGPRPAS